MKWKATLTDAKGRIIALATSDTLDNLNKDVARWVIRNGDTVKYEGPEEEAQ